MRTTPWRRRARRWRLAWITHHRLTESVKREAEGLAEGSHFVTTASINHEGAGFKGGV